jgi:2-methylcitrate dehydratase
MDRIVSSIYDYSRKVVESGTSRDVRDEIKKRIADSIIVSYGAKDSTPVALARKALLPSSGKLNSGLYFSREKASVAIATFINGTMTRYLDYNDTYLSREALHPSDNIPPILALSDPLNMDGERVIRSVDVAYEVVGALSDAVSIRDLGWDHVTYISISSAAGLATLADLEQDKFHNAINLALNNNISMRQTRAGELSMWKGATAANASRNSVFAVLLAMEGFTGPSPIFEGEMGFFKQVSGEFDLKLGSERILKTMIKNYPVEYHAMSAAQAACDLRSKIDGEITGIEVKTFTVADKIIIKDPEKLRPRTKETADHSMPFIIAYSLLYGEPDQSSFDDRYLNDQKILKLIDTMSFKVSGKYDSMYPEYLPFSIKVHTTKGEYSADLKVPKGHFKNPYTWDDLARKGRRVMGEDLSKSVIDVVKSIENRNISEIFEVISDVHTP